MTATSKKWKLFKGKRQLSLDLPIWFLNVLEKRGLNSNKEADSYLEPKYEEIVAYNNFFGTEEAAERISKAVKIKEKVLIYGDYDVDGITATALLVELLNKIGVHVVEAYIPHRTTEGYGLNKKAIDMFIDKGFSLIITVDCGIGSKKIIDSLDNADFIVIDHHKIDQKNLPKKSINIHPSLNKDNKEYSLSGCGMAFYFLRSVQSRFSEKLALGQEKWYLDLVALATICDVVPLIGENRNLAIWGLRVLSKTKRPGIIALAKVSGVDLSCVNSYDVGFLLGPRLNAAGRIENAKLTLELLTTLDQVIAENIAKKLNNLNMERQKMCERIIAEATREIERSKDKEDKLFLLSKETWPRGVVGIVASKLSEKHYRPVIIFENDGEKYHGSARSIDGFDIVEALRSCEASLEKYGGHAKAAGLTVKKENFAIFSEKLILLANKKIKETNLVKTIEIDAKIKISEITNEALELINKMEPTGFKNPRPVFLLEKVELGAINRVGGKKEHIKFKIKDKESLHSSEKISGIVFNEKRDLIESQKYDMVGTLKYNIWNNQKSIELRLMDFKESKADKQVNAQ